jgi:hypothetical protein
MFEEEYDYEEEEEDDVTSLIRDKFWAEIRSGMYKNICKGKGGYNQWAYIIGRKRFDKEGNKIRLTDKSNKVLQELVDYFDSEEGREELLKINILEPIDHIDTLIGYIQEARLMEEIKVEEFRLYLKNRDKILKFLSH